MPLIQSLQYITVCVSQYIISEMIRFEEAMLIKHFKYIAIFFPLFYIIFYFYNIHNFLKYFKNDNGIFKHFFLKRILLLPTI